jgi:hypothetical protein
VDIEPPEQHKVLYQAKNYRKDNQTRAGARLFNKIKKQQMKFTEKRVKEYQVKKHGGFFTVERLMVYSFLGFSYKTKWEPVKEVVKNKAGVLYEKHKIFQYEHTAKLFVTNEVNKKLRAAQKKGFKAEK